MIAFERKKKFTTSVDVELYIGERSGVGISDGKSCSIITKRWLDLECGLFWYPLELLDNIMIEEVIPKNSKQHPFDDKNYSICWEKYRLKAILSDFSKYVHL